MREAEIVNYRVHVGAQFTITKGVREQQELEFAIVAIYDPCETRCLEQWNGSCADVGRELKNWLDRLPVMDTC